VDPRDEFRDYFRWYFNQKNVSDDRDGLREEMEVVLPDRYDEQLDELAESQDIEEFIRQLDQGTSNENVPTTTPARGRDDEMNDVDMDADNSFPKDAKKILQDFQRGGLEQTQAKKDLVLIFGPGSESIAAKMLMVLTSDPSNPKENLEFAITEANYDLGELKKGGLGEQRGINFPICYDTLLIVPL
jgi:hypothetical protein